MNRRTLTYPMAALAVAAVLACGWLRPAAADQDKSPAAKPAAAESAVQTAPNFRFRFRDQPWKDVLDRRPEGRYVVGDGLAAGRHVQLLRRP